MLWMSAASRGLFRALLNFSFVMAFVLTLPVDIGGAEELQELPAGPNRELVYGQCATCHDLQYLKDSAGIPRKAWGDVIDDMKQYGLRIPPDQRARILNYLATYLGPNPPPQKSANAHSATPVVVDGAKVFRDQCTSCHQDNGKGVVEQFPPLAGNTDLFLSSDFPVRVVLFGLSGKISVNKKKFDSVMPPLSVLTDQQIVAVVKYAREAWGNARLRPESMPQIDAASVSALRKKQDTSPEQVYAYRAKLKAGSKKH